MVKYSPHFLGVSKQWDNGYTPKSSSYLGWDMAYRWDFPMEIHNQDARDAPSGSIVTLPHPRAGPGLTAARARGVSKPRKACGEQLAGSGEMLQARPGANEGV